MELRMNRPSEDEYEEVESPFAARTQEKSKLRSRAASTRKNVFNRPFNTESTVAPAVFETTGRRSVGHADQTEMLEHRQSALAETEIDYLDEEEEEMETRPARISTPKKTPKAKKNLLPKIGWALIGMLVVRLIAMDRGVWDYFATEREIRHQKNELNSIQTENRELKTEITRIQVDKNYQRQLAKEHLGVIAADEFLILFAGETPDVESDSKTEI